MINIIFFTLIVIVCNFVDYEIKYFCNLTKWLKNCVPIAPKIFLKNDTAKQYKIAIIVLPTF